MPSNTKRNNNATSRANARTKRQVTSGWWAAAKRAGNVLSAPTPTKRRNNYAPMATRAMFVSGGGRANRRRSFLTATPLTKRARSSLPWWEVLGVRPNATQTQIRRAHATGRQTTWDARRTRELNAAAVRAFRR